MPIDLKLSKRYTFDVTIISEKLILCAVLFPLAMFALHILSYQVFFRWRRPKSAQLFLLLLILTLNIPLVLTVVSLHPDSTLGQSVAMISFAFIVYNGISYAYFHLFNMTETARRLRMLVSLKNGMSLESLESSYSAQQQIQNRLTRLVEMNQISFNERYRLKRKFLAGIAQLLNGWRSLLGFRTIDKT